MKKLGIAFQGLPGSYSDLACRDLYPGHEPLACSTLVEACAAVTGHRAEMAMVPVDNSVAGPVADVHRLLPGSGLHVVAETFQRVRHQLLGLPGATLEGLSTVHSHVHALAQCRKLIQRLKLSSVIEADTAGAAARVATDGDPSQAAIASALAAEIHGLTILEADVEDSPRNTTRFLVMARDPRESSPGEAMITSLFFEVKNIPAALYKALGGFATNGVNLLRLESTMLDRSFTSTRFFCDIDGHPEDPGVERALDELWYFSSSVTIIGSYPADPIRSRAGRPA